MSAQASNSAGSGRWSPLGRRVTVVAAVAALALPLTAATAVPRARSTASPAVSTRAAATATSPTDQRAGTAPRTVLAPVQQLQVSSTTFHAIALSWTVDPAAPGATDVQGFVVRRALGDVAPLTPADGTPVARLDRWQRAATDTRLAPGTTASYAVFAVGQRAQHSTAATTTGTTVSHDGTTGISGRVTDSSGRGIAGVRVYVGSETNGSVANVVTNAQGRYLQTGVDADSWWVCFDPMVESPRRAPTGFAGECYDDKPETYGGPPRHPTLVTVRTGRITAHVDASLDVASSLSGRVVGADGSVVRHASVQVYGLRTMAETVVTSGPDGRYVVRGLPADRYRLCVTPDDASGSGSPTGYERACTRTRVAVAAHSAVTSPDVVLAVAAAVSGVVLTPAGQPIVGAAVSASSDGDWSAATTDSRGRYVLRGLTPGLYAVCFDARNVTSAAAPAGFVRECDGDRPYDDFPSPDLAVRAGRTLALDATLATGAGLRGTLTDASGHGVSNASVGLDGFYPELGYTDDAGRYAVNGLPAGAHSVCFSVSGGDVDSACYRDSAGPDGATVVRLRAGVVTALDMVLGGATGITGTILDEQGAPIPGVLVSAESFDFSGGYGYGSTDESGRYRVTGLAADDYRVRFDPSDVQGPPTGYVEQTYDNQTDGSATPVHVIRGSTTTADAVLAVGAAVSGTVTDEHGRPVVDARVYAERGDTSSRGAQTDDSGHYRLSGLPAGDSQICFYPSTDHPEAPLVAAECWDDKPVGDGTPVRLVPGEETTADAVLAASAGVGGRITDSAGTPLAYATVELRDTDGQSVSSATTDEAGRYLIGATPGSYEVCFSTYESGPHGTGYVPECYDHRQSGDSPTTVVVSASQVTQGIDGILSEGAAISGQVTSDAGPVSDVTVYLYRPDGSYLSGSGTDSEGSWSIPTLPAGPVVVCFDASFSPGRLSSECYDDQPYDPTGSGVRQVGLTSGEVSSGVDAVLSPAG